jgi:uncharacterized protein YecT (DUF1311 family)
MRWLIVIALLLTPLLPLPAADEKPKTLAEAKAAFAKADKALNEAWAGAKQALDESEFAALQMKQRQWVVYRDHRARGEDRNLSEAEAKKSPDYYETAAELTQARADWLRGRIKNDTDPVITGLWTDSFGGAVEIVQEKHRLLFVIEVVRGSSFHLGSLAGVATWNEPLGWFSDKGRDKDKPEETNLVFVRRGFVLEVIGANTSYYHGARAYFDGEYCKTGALDEKRKTAITKAAESGGIEEK